MNDHVAPPQGGPRSPCAPTGESCLAVDLHLDKRRRPNQLVDQEGSGLWESLPQPSDLGKERPDTSRTGFGLLRDGGTGIASRCPSRLKLATIRRETRARTGWDVVRSGRRRRFPASWPMDLPSKPIKP
jgi:hypothetical protein